MDWSIDRWVLEKGLERDGCAVFMWGPAVCMGNADEIRRKREKIKTKISIFLCFSWFFIPKTPENFKTKLGDDFALY